VDVRQGPRGGRVVPVLENSRGRISVGMVWAPSRIAQGRGECRVKQSRSKTTKGVKVLVVRI